MNGISELMEVCRRIAIAEENNTRAMPVGEAAYLLKKSKRTIFRYIAEGKLHKAYANGVNGVWASEVYALIDK